MQRFNTLSGPRARVGTFVVLAACALYGAIGHPAQAQNQAGVTAAVRGRVELAVRSGEVGRLIKSGEPVYLGNAIKSGPEAGLQLLLLDQTTFTIGPDSEITIDEFVYDPARGSGKVTASVAKGVFRFVTGKVAQGNPADMVVKLPVGTIGIRGTIAMGSVDRPDPQTLDGVKQQVVLVGPGSNVDGKDRIGAILLTTSGGGVTINKPGFGSQFGGQSWGEPIRFTPEMIGAIQNRLNPPPPPGSGGQKDQGSGGQATSNAGAGATIAKGEAQQLSLLTNAINYANNINNDANNQQVRDTAVDQGQDAQQLIIDGITTFGQLRATTGTYNFSQTNVPVSNGTGTYSLFVNVDAGSRIIGGPGSRLELKTSGVSGTGFPTPFNFSGVDANQFVVFDIGEGNGTGDFVGSACGASQTCNVGLVVAALNAGGKTAANLLHLLSVFTDQDGFLFGGSGIAAQQPGLVTDPNPILAGNSSYDQLRTINSGQFNYAQSGVSLGGGNSYSIFANIDFGARTFGNGNSRVVIAGGTMNGTIPLGAQNYAALAGASNFQYISNLFLGAGCSPACTTTINAAPQNANSVVALQLNHNVSVSNGFSIVGNGSGTANRAGGLTP